MKRPQARRVSCGRAAICLLVACIGACAGPAASHPHAETQGGEAEREEAPAQCRAVDATVVRDVGERGGEPSAAEAESSRADAPSTPTNTAAPSPAPGREADQPNLAELYAAQDSNVDTLGAALDASDCATAARLGGEICRLAERVCSLDACDPRCEEARGRCTRALDRIQTRCGGR